MRRRTGAPREQLLAGAGLDARALRDPEAPVPLRAVYGVWATAMRTLRDDGFPIAVARGFRLEHYPTLGFAVMTSPTGYEAIARVVRFSGIIATAGRWETQGHRDHLRVRWLRDGERTLGHRAANESILAELLHGLRQAFGEDVAATAVSLRHPHPATRVSTARISACRLSGAPGTTRSTYLARSPSARLDSRTLRCRRTSSSKQPRCLSGERQRGRHDRELAT